MQLTFVILQAIALLILLVQDTVNLAPFNNLSAQVRYLGWTKLLLGTLFTVSGAAVSLYLTIRFDGVPLPTGAKLFFVLWWSMLMLGMYASMAQAVLLWPHPEGTRPLSGPFRGHS